MNASHPTPNASAAIAHLVFWRHAQAQAGANDLERPLTALGLRQAAEIAQKLHQELPAPQHWEVWVSPARRTQQTVAALNHPYQTVPDLGPDLPIRRFVDAIQLDRLPTDGSVRLIVGHQPTLGMIASKLVPSRQDLLAIDPATAVWLAFYRSAAGELSAQLQAKWVPSV